MTLGCCVLLLLAVNYFSIKVLSFNPLLTYSVRFMPFITYPNISGELSISQYKDKQYVSGNVTINTPLVVDNMVVLFYRCDAEGINCEYFQTWFVNDICTKVNQKNQIWSSWYSAFDPAITCPISKSNFLMKNATIEIGPLQALYSEVTFYQWKVTQKMYSGTSLVGSYTMHINIFGYRKKFKNIIKQGPESVLGIFQKTVL